MTFNAEKYLGSGAPILALLMGHQCLMTAQVYEHEALWRSGPGPLKYSLSPVHWSSELYDEICVTLAGRAAQQVNICRFSDWHISLQWHHCWCCKPPAAALVTACHAMAITIISRCLLWCAPS
jgi:hypothetical protein